MTFMLNYVACSDRGLVRSNNEDSVYAGPRLLALADGMGGHAAGEVASRLVIATIAPLDDTAPGDDLLGPLGRVVELSVDGISKLETEDSSLEGMGTTLTAILFAGSRVGIVHIGDSRGYLLREGALTQITRDDTFVQVLVDEGRVAPEQARHHPQRALVLKALTSEPVEPSLTLRSTQLSDRYLICSDGLSDMVSFEHIEEAMAVPDLQECADLMVELALRAGGTDNISIILADVVEVDSDDHTPPVGIPVILGADLPEAAQQLVVDEPATDEPVVAEPEPEPEPESAPEVGECADGAGPETTRTGSSRRRWSPFSSRRTPTVPAPEP